MQASDDLNLHWKITMHFAGFVVAFVRAQTAALPMLFRDRRSALLTASYFALYVVLTSAGVLHDSSVMGSLRVARGWARRTS